MSAFPKQANCLSVGERIYGLGQILVLDLFTVCTRGVIAGRGRSPRKGKSNPTCSLSLLSLACRRLPRQCQRQRMWPPPPLLPPAAGPSPPLLPPAAGPSPSPPCPAPPRIRPRWPSPARAQRGWAPPVAGAVPAHRCCLLPPVRVGSCAPRNPSLRVTIHGKLSYLH